VIILAACLALLSWIFVPYVFNNPHVSSNYKILDKIGRLPKIKAFSALDPPEGDISGVKSLYHTFRPLTSDKLELHNEELIKNYIGNFKHDYINTYVQGDFRVIKTRVLTKNDRFTKGIAIQAVALLKQSKYSEPKIFPVWIEIILPNAPASAAEDIRQGDMMEINKNPFFASVLHVQRIERVDDDPIMNFTIVPLVYESPWNPPHGSQFTISPPDKLNMSAKLPIFEL